MLVVNCADVTQTSFLLGSENETRENFKWRTISRVEANDWIFGIYHFISCSHA